MAYYTAELDYPEKFAPAVTVYKDGAQIGVWAGWNKSISQANDWLNQEFRLMMGNRIGDATNDYGRTVTYQLEEI